MPRWLRLSLVLLGILLTAGAAYRARQNDVQRVASRVAAQTADVVGRQAMEDLLDLRASLHAFVAPGQGGFWFTRSTTLLDELRTGFTTLEPVVVRAGGTFADAIGTLSKLVAAEKRAARYADGGQALLAGDVIFTEGRDLTELLRTRLTEARQLIAADAARREAVIFDDQLKVAAVALGIWLLIALALVPTPTPVESVVAMPAAPRLALDPDYTDIPSVEETARAAESSSAAIAQAARTSRSSKDARESRPDRSPAAAIATAPAAAAAPDLLPAVAALCRDFGAMNDASQLATLLAGTATLMQARSLVVWVPDGDDLLPTLAHGDDPDQLLPPPNGGIPPRVDDLATAAYRNAEPRTIAGDRAAVAVPVIGATGVIGVLSAELRAGQSLGTATALATIVAAQLATVITPPPDAATAAVEDPGATAPLAPHQHAQA